MLWLGSSLNQAIVGGVGVGVGCVVVRSSQVKMVVQPFCMLLRVALHYACVHRVGNDMFCLSGCG